MTATLSMLAPAAGAAEVRGNGEVPVLDLAFDSRRVAEGTLFFCVPGRKTDGHDHAGEAVRRGAAGLVVERWLDHPVPQLRVPSARRSMGTLAAEFFGHPSRAMTLVGVTGTNGKTTTTYMFDAVFRALGLRAGLLGNIERRIGDKTEPVDRNTPEAIDLQRLLARMRDAGVTHAVMEVTSEGLLFGRADGTRFACAVFTNLTQDHLNTHGTMEAYFDAKAMLFEERFSTTAAINVDDEWGRRLVERTHVPVTTFGFGDAATVRGLEAELGPWSSRATVAVDGKRVTVDVPLAARYNVYNALGVLAASAALGLPLDDVARGVASLPGVPGRVERVDAGQDFTVLVDYAHTPDSLDNVLRAAREITPPGARLVVVFGCGGDRDKGKRPLMGKVACELADHTVITSDNPRSEDPLAIVEQVVAGARSADGSYETIVDRREAIATALGNAKTGDVVLIAGKGHETGQEFSDRTIPFDDRTVALEVLRSL